MLALGTAVTTAVPPMVIPEPVSREPAVPVAYFFNNIIIIIIIIIIKLNHWRRGKKGVRFFTTTDVITLLQTNRQYPPWGIPTPQEGGGVKIHIVVIGERVR